MLLETTAQPSGANYTLYLLLAALLVGMWFLSRRSRKQQQQREEFRNTLKTGDEVMTASGLFGTVVEVDGDVITLESTPGVRTLWLRAAIAKVGAPPFASTAIGDAADDDAEGELDEDGDEYDEDYDDLEELDEDVEVPDDLSSLEEGSEAKPEDPEGTDQK